MAQFVKVSGYGQDDIDNAIEYGKDVFLQTCASADGFGQQLYVETNTSTEYTFFTERQVAKHCILVMIISAASQNSSGSTAMPTPEITLNVQNGTARQIKYQNVQGYKTGELDMYTRYAWYEVTAGSTISATYRVLGRGSNVVGIAFLIDA